MNDGAGRELGTLAEVQAEIERLERQRDEYQRTLDDPEQRRQRRVRRQQLLGRAAESFALSEQLIQTAQSLAGADTWLFDSDLMRADGWTVHEARWTLSAESRSG